MTIIVIRRARQVGRSGDDLRPFFELRPETASLAHGTWLAHFSLLLSLSVRIANPFWRISYEKREWLFAYRAAVGGDHHRSPHGNRRPRTAPSEAQRASGLGDSVLKNHHHRRISIREKISELRHADSTES